MRALKSTLSCLYDVLLRPKSNTGYSSQKEYIFNISALTFLNLNLVVLIFSTYKRSIAGHDSLSAPIFFIFLSFIFLICVYIKSRIEFSKNLAAVFVSLCVVLVTLELGLYGLPMAHGLLIYALAILISGIVVSSKAALGVMLVIIILTNSLSLVEFIGASSYLEDFALIFSISDAITYDLIFLAIFSVLALSNKNVKNLITKIKSTEQELIKQKESIELKIEQKIAEIENIQAKKAKEIYRFAEFGKLSSSIIHDLANPVTAVSLSFGQIESGQKSEPVNHIRENLTFLEQYIQSARRQLSGEGEIALFDCGNKIKKVANLMKSRAQGGGVSIKLNLEKELRIKGDAVRFSQIISNLLGNAIDSYDQNSSEDKIVKVSMSFVAESNSLLIVVSDKGCGIKSCDVKNIFEPFYTTKSMNSGSGLGLTITKSIVEEDFRGTIGVFSKEQLGTKFSIEIPLNSK